MDCKHFDKASQLLVAWLILLAAPAEAAIPASVTLGDLVHTYDGAPKTPSVITSPPDLPYQLIYRDLSPSAPAAESQIVFDDTPGVLDLSYQSYAFAAQQLSALGNFVQLGGNARRLQACEAILVTWAKAADWPELAAANPAGYYHPIKITLYEVTTSNQLVFLKEATQNVLIPWRPLTKPNGQPYTLNGYALRAVIPFPDGTTLPERVLAMVSFNTQSSGFEPIGVPGPYNTLNVAMEAAAVTVGMDVNRDVVLQVKNNIWYYPSTGWTGTSAPMLRIRALTTDRTNPPVQAGSWSARARISNPDYSGSATDTLMIGKADATVTLGSLVATYDGSLKPVSAVTVPEGLALNVTYDEYPEVPSDLGRYAVRAEVEDPNYQGAATGELWIGHQYSSWLDPWLQDGSIDPDASGPFDDPDNDGISNLIEYACSLDPSSSAHGLTDRGTPRVEWSGGKVSLIYRKNLSATDLEFQVETSVTLEGMESWSAATTTDTILASEGGVQTIRATMTPEPGEDRRFLRLRVSRP